jgi:hypothetical protein
MMYWQNQDDGETIYQIELDPGNYTYNSLASAIESKVSNVQRNYIISSNFTSYTNSNFINVTINLDTNKVIFKSYKEALLTNPISEIVPIITDTEGAPPFTLTITQDSHGLHAGDTVLFSGFIATMGIPENVLNKNHIVSNVINSSTYQIVVDNFNLSTVERINTEGGYSAKAYIPNNFKLLFNTSDTFGTLLGFRDVGNDTSVTKFGTTITNYDEYDGEVVTTDVNGNKYIYNKSGSSNLLTGNSIKLTGYDYILLSIEELNSIYNIGTPSLPNFFSKINLTKPPGNILYDTFVPSLTSSYEPFDLNKLTIKFFSPDGKLFDFNGLDHSFVLEITTMEYTILEEGIISNKIVF